MDVTVDQRINGVQHVLSPILEDPIQQDNPEVRNVDGPFFGQDVPKLDVDPFDALLKPLLERDSKQCNAWKDEVQNILVFAGLFSGVITAFIIQSYHRLLPDPNSQMIMLLSQISNQLTTPPTTATAPLIVGVNEPFTPLRSDIRVNIFWFISLVLSLTVALIGIVSLQWLREHQHYDSNMEPALKVATFNARSEGLRRWYVQQFFAGLPLLLQCALVLFFVGLIDFLFSIQIQVVAIFVTASLSIPILFLLATTLLPTLQLFTLKLPHLLSVNYHVPAPCPYKSPQSIIVRRAAVFSDTVFRPCAYIFATIYAPFVTIVRFFATSKKPFYGKSAPFHKPIDSGFELVVRSLRQPQSSSDWTSIDREWLKVRTSYAAIVHTPDDLHDAHTNTRRLALGSLTGDTGFYDCIQAMVLGKGKNSIDIIYHCGDALVEEQCRHWERVVPQISGEPEYQKLTMRGRQMAFMAVLAPNISFPTNYLQTTTEEILPDGKVLRNAYRAALMELTQVYGMEPAGLAASQRWLELHMRFITPYLLESTRQFFECPSTDVLPRRRFFNLVLYHRGHLESHCRHWMHAMSDEWTPILLEIIENSTRMTYSAFTAPHTCSSTSRCRVDVRHRQVQDLTKYILLFQTDKHIERILYQLHFCITELPSKSALEEMPYALVIACAYINAVAAIGYHSQKFNELVTALSTNCGNQPKTFDNTIEPGGRMWAGLEPALAYIHNNQTHAQTQTNPNNYTPRRNLSTASYPPAGSHPQFYSHMAPQPDLPTPIRTTFGKEKKKKKGAPTQQRMIEAPEMV